MENIVPYLSATSTILGLVFFVGIIWWAWSANRQAANQESANRLFSEISTEPDDGGRV